METDKRTSGLAFHCRHDQLYEFVYDYDERVRFIKANKPQKEQALRLRLLRMIPLELVPGKDTEEYQVLTKAGEVYDRAWKAFSKVREVREATNKAREAIKKVEKAYDKKWEA